jgi:hypothetical protein
MYDGCPDKPASPKVFNSVDEAKDFIRDFTEKNWDFFKRYPKASLDILDVHSQRLISYVL